MCDPRVFRMLPRDTRFARVLPVALAGDVLSVVVDVIPTPAQFKALERAAGMLVALTVVPPAVLDQLRAQNGTDEDGVPNSISPALAHAVELNASDLHLGVGAPPMARVSGSLVPLPGWAPLSGADLEEAARWIAGSLDGFKGDLDKSITYQGRRWRVSLYWQRGGLAVALRPIPITPPSGDALGLPAAVLQLADLHSGLVLFTGATGSGKSTSMAALVDRVNRSRACHILTVEDPIEYLHPNKKSLIHQREVGSDTADFSVGLRSALRQDPDVILIGELRDLETMSMAIAAAETGHLVFATVHTSSAPGAIPRLVSSFPAAQQEQVRQQLAGSLQGVVFQKLLPKRGGGRVLAVEVLTCTTGVRNIIREDRIHELASQLDSSGLDSGMTSLDRSLANLVAAGQIDVDTAHAHLRNREVFEQFLAKAGGAPVMDDFMLDGLPSFGTRGEAGP